MSDSVRPWHLFMPNEPKVDEEIRKERYEICKSCEHFFKPTKQCRKCGCFMELKTMLAKAECPVGKWGRHKAGNGK